MSAVGAGAGLTFAVAQWMSRIVVVGRLVRASTVDELLSGLTLFRRVHSLTAVLVGVSWLVAGGAFAALLRRLWRYRPAADASSGVSAGGSLHARLWPGLSVPLRQVSGDPARLGGMEPRSVGWCAVGGWLVWRSPSIRDIHWSATVRPAGTWRCWWRVGSGRARSWSGAVLQVVDRSFMVTRDGLAVALLATAVVLHGLLMLLLARRSAVVGPRSR
jgi:hypothetical protein